MAGTKLAAYPLFKKMPLVVRDVVGGGHDGNLVPDTAMPMMFP